MSRPMMGPAEEKEPRPPVVRADTLSISQEINALTVATQIINTAPPAGSAAAAGASTSTPPIPQTTLTVTPATANAAFGTAPNTAGADSKGGDIPRLTVKTDRPIGSSGGVVLGSNGMIINSTTSPTDGKFGAGAINKPTNSGVGGRIALAPSHDPAPLQADLVLRQGHVRVDLSLRILRVTEIDYLTQSFSVEAIIITEFVNPALIGLDGAEGARRCKEWLPRVTVKNLIRSTAIGNDVCKLVDVRTGRVQLSSHQRLTLTESIDLSAYPFDRHTLSVVFRAEHSAHEVELVVNKKIESTVECFGGGSAGGEYFLTHTVGGEHKPMQELRCETFEMNSDRLDGLRHSELVCSMTVLRNTSAATTNLWAVSFLLGLSLWFSFFWVTNDDALSAHAALSLRLNTSYMVLIAACAYRIYLALVGPKLSYRTLADTHYLVLFVFIFIMMCESAVISALWNSPNGYQSIATLIDIIARYAIPSGWLLWNVGLWWFGSGLLYGTRDWSSNSADGLQRAYSNLEYATKRWVIAEPVSARTVTGVKSSAAAAALARAKTLHAAGGASTTIGGTAPSFAGGLGLAVPSTKSVHRDGRPVAGAKPAIALPKEHKPQPHHAHAPSLANSGGNSKGGGAGTGHPIGVNKRTNSGSMLPSVASKGGGGSHNKPAKQ